MAAPTVLRSRKPTGKPSWPILLLAGAEKAGKSYAAAKAAASPLVGRTYWVTIGEDQPDEYGQLGDFDIVDHDGKYRSILGTIRLINQQTAPQDGVPLLVVDSMSRLWDLITGNAQDTANDRAAAKARKSGRNEPDGDAQITMDLWNAAKDQWTAVMDAIRAFPGPVILTARLDQVAVMNDKGEPTKEKQSKVQAHKSLPYDVGAVIEMPVRGEAWIKGVRSVRFPLAAPRRENDFDVDRFWRQLGLEGIAPVRDHQIVAQDTARVDTAQAAAQIAGRAAFADTAFALRGLYREAKQTNLLAITLPSGTTLEEFLLERGQRLAAEEALAASGEPEHAPMALAEPPEPDPAADDEAYNAWLDQQGPQ